VLQPGRTPARPGRCGRVLRPPATVPRRGRGSSDRVRRRVRLQGTGALRRSGPGGPRRGRGRVPRRAGCRGRAGRGGRLRRCSPLVLRQAVRRVPGRVRRRVATDPRVRRGARRGLTLRPYGVNIAVTFVSEATVNAHVPVPGHVGSPPHASNTPPPSGVAVSVTSVPGSNSCEHDDVQSIPGGELVTVPAPVTVTVSVSVTSSTNRYVSDPKRRCLQSIRSWNTWMLPSSSGDT